MSNIIKAEPTKEFFISMLTRDITTDRAILDLIDNSLDAGMKNEVAVVRIELNISEDAFSIKDNAGGLDLEIAKAYAFCFGRSASTPDTPNSIGQFGVGMKRTLFKIGTEFQLVSNYQNVAYIVNVNVAQWLAQDGWDLTFDMLELQDVQLGETNISVTELKPEVRELFNERTFKNNLQLEIASAYFKQLYVGHKIVLNGNEIRCKDILIKSSANLGTVRKSFTTHDVTVEIICGVMDRDIEEGGWNVVCNGRLVTSKEQSDLTGWGIDGIPKYHANYAFFRGLVEFTAADSSKLPWTTTKTGVDRDSGIYKRALYEMESCMQDVLLFLRERAEEVTQFADELIATTPLNDAIVGAQVIRIYDAPLSNAFERPQKLTIPAQISPTVKIQYWANTDKVNQVKEYLGATSNAKVGEVSFAYFYKSEIGDE